VATGQANRDFDRGRAGAGGALRADLFPPATLVISSAAPEIEHIDRGRVRAPYKLGSKAQIDAW
jgi:hypothetical protein